jgi:hypothetical protein
MKQSSALLQPRTAPTKRLYLRKSPQRRNNHSLERGFYIAEFARGDDPINFIDSLGLSANDIKGIVGVQGGGVSNRQFERVKQAAEDLKASNTEAGNRFKELEGNTTRIVTITVTKDLPYGTGGTAVAKNKNGAGNGEGSGTDVQIDANVPLINGDKTLGTRLAHEVSGHAYDNYKGTNEFYKYNDQWTLQETAGRVGAEEYAVGIENEYRYFLGLNQRNSYYIDTAGKSYPMPTYDPNKRR